MTERIALDDFLEYVTDKSNKVGFREYMTPGLSLADLLGMNYQIEVLKRDDYDIKDIPGILKANVLDSNGKYVCGIE